MEIFPRILFKPKVYRLWCSGSRCYEVSYVGNIKLKKTNGRVTEIDITYAHSTENTAQLMEWLDNRRILAQVPAMLTHFSVCSPPRPALSPNQSHIQLHRRLVCQGSCSGPKADLLPPSSVEFMTQWVYACTSYTPS